MKLTPRLQAIADLVEKQDRVADIGTDHGYLPIYLLETGKVQSAIAADINEMPLQKAKEISIEYGYEDKMDTRLGSGLEVLQQGEVQTVIIAGMGGVLMTELLAFDMDLTRSIDRFIFQPMVASDVLRVYLAENDFEIINEEIAIEGKKYYEIIVAKPNSQKNIVFQKHDEILGPILKNKKGDHIDLFYKFKISKYKNIYDNIKKNSKKDASTELSELREIISSLEKVMMDRETK